MIEKTCPFCGLILTNGGRHIYTCKHNTEKLSKEEIKLKYLQHLFGDNILNEVCNDYKQLYSLPDIRSKYNIDFKSICFLLDYNKIPRRTISESSEKISQKKFKDTCEHKYGKGITNPSQSDEIKNKKKNTFLKHYGVDNVWKLQDYNKKCAELHPESHKEHMKKVQAGRDKFWKNLTDERKAEFVKKASKTREQNGFYQSKLETKFCEILNKLNLSYTRQYHIKHKSHPYDFALVDTNIIIEINGNFWHANPLYYKENDILTQPGRKIKAKDIWEKDKKFIDDAINNGYKVLIFWEDDFNINDEYLTNLLIEKLNNIKDGIL